MIKENMAFYLGEDKIEVPIYFPRFSLVKKEIFLELFNLRFYKVHTRCRKEVFEQYIKFWKTGDQPTIDSYNCWEFYQLSEEFEVPLEISPKFKHELRISKLMSIGTKYEANDISAVEQSICEEINVYLDQYPDEFFSIPVTSLYNIFHKGLDKLNDKNQAYKLICQYAKKKNKDLYALFNVFNTDDLSENAILDVAFNIENHEYFAPKITLNALEILIKQNDNVSKRDYIADNFYLKQDLKDNERMYKSQIQDLKNENDKFKRDIDDLNKEIDNLKKEIENLKKKKHKTKPRVKFSKSAKAIRVNITDNDNAKFTKSQNNINIDDLD